MNKKEIIIKWTATLRSKKYKQGKEYLRTIDNEFCCLGVLCDIIDNTKWKNFYEEDSYEWNGNSRVIRDENIINFLDLDFPSINQNHSLQTRLVEMNDNGASFEEIADYIEEYYDENL